jgi:hypothetical protein
VANATLAASATALAANGANCAAGTFPLGVDASGAAETCTALPTTITGTANQITASASTGAVTLSLPATITGLASVTSTSFTGALTGNATTATALASSVTSGRLWIANGTGVPTSDSGLTFDTSTKALVASGDFTLSTDGKAILSAAGTLYLKPSITNTEQYIQVSPTGTATITGVILKGQLSGTTGTRADILQSGADTIIRNQTLGAGAQGAITLEQNGSVRLKVFAATGNIAIGTTTDLGYGLHAANKGTNGNLLVFDPTSTSGISTQLITGGQGQGSTPVFRIRAYNATPGSGTLGLSILDTGRIVTASANEATGAGTPLFGTNSPAVTNTAPYTWIKFTTSDGSTVYVPAWK